MNKPRIAFFGTPDYSVLVLDKLHTSGFPICAVVTKPPRPIGREKQLIETPVTNWAREKQIPTLQPSADSQKPWYFADETQLTTDLLAFKPELLISADYTQKIPLPLIQQTKHGGLNIHPSLLPSYRGPAPIPWALVQGETVIGVSIVTLSDTFDAGQIIAQKKIPVLPTDTTPSLLRKLFILGADLLISTLPKYLENPQSTTVVSTMPSSYFSRLTRDHGFEPWDAIKDATTGLDAERIERKFRAFHPWPGLWTKIKLTAVEKRLKLLKLHLEDRKLVLDEVQLEGKKPFNKQDTTQFLTQL